MLDPTMLDPTALDIIANDRPTHIPVSASHGFGQRRIMFVQTQAEGAGAQEISRILSKGLAAKGHETHHVFFFRRTAAFDHIDNVFFCSRERPSGPFPLVRMLLRLVTHIRRVQPDVVLCFAHYGNIVGGAAAFAAGARGIIANRTTDNALVPKWAQRLDRVMGQAGVFKAVVVNSHKIESEYASYPPKYRARLVRIDHGFEAKRSDLPVPLARQQVGLPPDVPLLGCVARLHPGKNLGSAIRLLTHDPTWHLALAGQGPAQAELLALARTLGVADRLHLTGELAPEQVSRFLRSLDAFVFPTLAESFGLAAIEAADAGIPVVANDLDVLREVLASDGEPCALFVDVARSEVFAGAVKAVLHDKALRERLIGRGTELGRRYALDAMTDRFADLIETIAAPCAR